MYATTRDFVTFTEAQIWQPDEWRIDCTVKKVALRTKSFEHPKWEVVPVNFPEPLPKHGTILPITATEAKALTTAYSK